MWSDPKSGDMDVLCDHTHNIVRTLGMSDDSTTQQMYYSMTPTKYKHTINMWQNVLKVLLSNNEYFRKL